jgi:hypothetical protein
VGGDAQVIDLPATFASEGLIGPLPRNALVVKNCAGIQIGNWNKQTKEPHEGGDLELPRRAGGQLQPAAQRVRHVVTGPEIALGRGDTAIVDQLRDGRADAAERALVKMVRRAFEQDAAQLYAALDTTCNVQLPAAPPVVENTFGGEYGLGNEQKIREDIAVAGVNVTDLVDTLIEALLQTEALKGSSSWEEAVATEPVELEPSDALDLDDIVPEAEPSDPTAIDPVKREPPPPAIDEPAQDPWFRW